MSLAGTLLQKSTKKFYILNPSAWPTKQAHVVLLCNTKVPYRLHLVSIYKGNPVPKKANWSLTYGSGSQSLCFHITRKNLNHTTYQRDMDWTQNSSRNALWNSSKSNSDLDLWPMDLVLYHDTPSIYKEYFCERKLKSINALLRYGPDTKSGWTDGRTDVVTDGQTDGRTDRRTDGRMDSSKPLVPQPELRSGRGSYRLASVCPSVRLSVCPSVRLSVSKNFNIGHNFCTVRGRAFIFYTSVPCDKTFPLVPIFFIMCPWPWPLTFIWKTLTLDITIDIRDRALIFDMCVPCD